jgi:hypothetical protein
VSACPEDRLEDFVRGDLVGAEAASVRRHVDGCASCTGEAQWLMREREALSVALFTRDPLPPAARVLSLAAPPRPVASWLGVLSLALAPVAALVAITFVGARPIAEVREPVVVDARDVVPACFLGGDATEGANAVELAYAACLVASPRPGRAAADSIVTDRPLSSLGSEACE